MSLRDSGSEVLTQRELPPLPRQARTQRPVIPQARPFNFINSVLPPVICIVLALLAYNSFMSMNAPAVPIALDTDLAPHKDTSIFPPPYSAPSEPVGETCGGTACGENSVCIHNGGWSRCVVLAQGPSSETASKDGLSPPSGSGHLTLDGKGCDINVEVTSRNPGADEFYKYRLDSLLFTNSGSHNVSSVDIEVVMPNFVSIDNFYAMEKQCCSHTGSVAKFTVDLHNTNPGDFFQGTPVIMYRYAQNAHFAPGQQSKPEYIVSNRVCAL